MENLPRWLKVIPYRPPANMEIPGLSVLLLQIAPEQAPSEETVDAEPASDDVETAVDTDMPEAESGPDGEEARPAGRGSFLRWTNEEAGNSPIDLTLPDFPSIDISSLEDESQPG